MEKNASFVDTAYCEARSQTEELVRECDDIVLFRSTHCPMALKAAAKRYMALSQGVMLNALRSQMPELPVQVLGLAAKSCMNCMSLRLVNKMTLHCTQTVAVNAMFRP
ncbi:hypothetical protein PHYSODRAFT_340606 [Phytophthora sojae]|uniref:Uncharacterized protein n=1 Tax=Phytophthora sojae (strain P6497) TaxID=1094619 RepID=G5AA97_PHYSP|nr:hypothetical protein PHYSODRAFT_340606 [Phytophthora sojae]EGZ07526.1 hypothetical protein PHYSODRAFT_340606 [Phytophthora sojae]|eukprot:XP_009537092.1 hypothetical protein PHYSODRAFT_340606 [Phytophthora sojae]